ncbi:MAG: hydantoinase/oxoprolinase family protein [Clostridiales bacterium]|nr:hydantoinase/oxoprolinase family protein [Clostridiales bacterium]
MSKIGIGIDTGGTYTDAVIFDLEQNKVLASAKSLTTKQDLSIGIDSVLSKLPEEMVAQAEMIGLSTTLATNACVENKGGRAKLLFLGGDKKVVEKVGAQYGFHDLNDIFYEERITTLSGDIIRTPDWKQFSSTIEERFGDCAGVGIVEIYAMRNGGILEKEAKKLIQEKLDIPVTCSNELFSDLGSLPRGASALLNARLIPIIREFMQAVHKVLNSRNIHAPIVIMRSDGSVMSEEFAKSHPVETLLCGPAASVVGAGYTAATQNCVIVDMGGTTTDIALIENNNPVRAEDGISIGQWKTYVKGLLVDTFGLGGDSAIRFSDNKLQIDSVRVIPLCILAQQYPQMKERLSAMIENEEFHVTRFLHEWYCPVKDIQNNPHYSEEEKRFCRAIQEHPLILSDAAKSIDKDIYTLNVKRLEDEGIVIRSGLTPTDIMHLTGDFTEYDKEASLLGAQYVARCLNVETKQLCDAVYDEIKKKLYCNIVRVLLQHSVPYYKKHGIDEGLSRLIENSWSDENQTIHSLFQTPFSLVGVGAPIHVFLDDVAKKLGTKAIIPEFAGVTNAIGAVAGNVSVQIEISILPATMEDESDGYIVYGPDANYTYTDLEQAIQKAIEIGTEKVRQDMAARGAFNNITVSHKIKNYSGEAADNTVYLDTGVIVEAH